MRGAAGTADATADRAAGTVDRRAGWLATGFLLLLLSSEAALTLPDEQATSSFVADFYAAHRVMIVVLQVAGFVAAGLLGGYARRLRRADRPIAAAGMLLAVVSAAPGVITAITAVVADPQHPVTAGALNQLEPAADDALFVCVLLFAVTVLLRASGRHPWLGAAAALTAVTCLARFVLEASGQTSGPLLSLAPVCFLVLIGWMAGLSFRGLLLGPPASGRIR